MKLRFNWYLNVRGKSLCINCWLLFFCHSVKIGISWSVEQNLPFLTPGNPPSTFSPPRIAPVPDKLYWHWSCLLQQHRADATVCVSPASEVLAWACLTTCSQQRLANTSVSAKVGVLDCILNVSLLPCIVYTSKISLYRKKWSPGKARDRRFVCVVVHLGGSGGLFMQWCT